MINAKQSDVIHDPPTRRSPSFEQIHERGVLEFGMRWMNANRDAIGMAALMGVDYTDPKMKRLISLVVLRALYAGRIP